MGTVFVSQPQMLPHTYSVNTHPARADHATSGYTMINDLQNEFSPLMTHDYTCLQSCAREVFTSPRAEKWQFHGQMSFCQYTQHQQSILTGASAPGSELEGPKHTVTKIENPLVIAS